MTGGVDHVVDIGSPGTLRQTIAAMKLGEHIGLIGVLAGRAGEIPTAMIKSKLVRLRAAPRSDHLAMIAALNVNGIRPVIDSSYPRRLWATHSGTRRAVRNWARS